MQGLPRLLALVRPATLPRYLRNVRRLHQCQARDHPSSLAAGLSGKVRFASLVFHPEFGLSLSGLERILVNAIRLTAGERTARRPGGNAGWSSARLRSTGF